MTTTITTTFTADAGSLILGNGHTYGPPAEIGSNSDFKTRDPVAFAAAQEFNNLGTTSGTVTITAA